MWAASVYAKCARNGTTTWRRGTSTRPHRPALHTSARLGGEDYRHRWGKYDDCLALFLAGMLVTWHAGHKPGGLRQRRKNACGSIGENELCLSYESKPNRRYNRNLL